MSSTTTEASSINASAANSGLLLLPEELFIAVTRSLEFNDVKTLSLVNKKLRKQCRARLFAKIIMDVPAVEAGRSMRDCIVVNYHNLHFVRTLELHIGCQQPEVFLKQDLTVANEEFAALFALVQGSITDILYNFYTRGADPYNARERTLFSAITKTILCSSRISHIQGHVHTSEQVRHNDVGSAMPRGLAVALPYFTSPGHLQAIVANGSCVRSKLISLILQSLPPNCRPNRCEFSSWCFPDNSVELLPNSLRDVSLAIEKWEDFGSGSYVKAMLRLQTTCPDLVALRLNAKEERHFGFQSLETIEALLLEANEVPVVVNFSELKVLEISCGHKYSHQIALGHAFGLLMAPKLSHLTLEGAPSWFCLSSLDMDVFLQNTKLTSLTLRETLCVSNMTGDTYPWSDAPDIPAISRPLFQNLMLRLEASGVDVRLHAVSDANAAFSYDFTPDHDGFRIPLATIQSHVQHLRVQYFQPEDEDPPEISDNYSFPQLHSLDLYISMVSAFSGIAETWDAPALESMNIQTRSENARDAALLVSDMTDSITDGSFARLRKITGEIRGLLPQTKTKSAHTLNSMFIKAFLVACAQRQINTEGLEWT